MLGHPVPRARGHRVQKKTWARTCSSPRVRSAGYSCTVFMARSCRMHFNAITCFSQRSLVCARARAHRLRNVTPEIEADALSLSLSLSPPFVVISFLGVCRNNKASACSVSLSLSAGINRRFLERYEFQFREGEIGIIELLKL